MKNLFITALLLIFNLSANAQSPCQPISDLSYTSLIKSIEEKEFVDIKMELAQQGVKGKCLKVDQVKGLMEFFESDSDRLKVAKYAFTHSFEGEDFEDVADALKFEQNKSALKEFIAKNK